jgi:hypothetical protein
MLQSGETPSDFVSVGKSQGSDIISWREFRTGLKVRDGRIVLSSGRSYPFLGIPHDGLHVPADVQRIDLAAEKTEPSSSARNHPALPVWPAIRKATRKSKSSTLWTDEAVR